MDIKSIIKEKGYTIQDVAKKMGVNRVTLTLTSKSHLQKVERDSRRH